MPTVVGYKYIKTPPGFMRDSADSVFLRHWQSNFYATAQLIPNAVPTAARIADAKFHKNLINLDLFS